MALIFLKEITSVTRTDLKPYCIEIATKDKTYYVACKSDDELYSWMDEIYNVSLLFFSSLHAGAADADANHRDPPWALRAQPILYTKSMLASTRFPAPLL